MAWSIWVVNSVQNGKLPFPNRKPNVNNVRKRVFSQPLSYILDLINVFFARAMLLYTYAYNRIADVSTYSNVQMLSISLIEPYSARRCRKNIRRDKSRKISLGEAFDLWTLSFFSYLPRWSPIYREKFLTLKESCIKRIHF